MKHLVLGAGVSGTAAARLLRRHGHEVAFFDDRPEALVDLADEAYEMHTGEWARRHLKGVGRVIASPGFSEFSQPVVDSIEADVEVWSELELGFRHTDASVVAVTGTNGKTTTTQLITDMAVAAGVAAVAAGNIGQAMCDVAESDYSLIVAEASSFQLRFIDTFAPAAAAVLNVAPDHLDWHGSFEAYAAAKARITENMDPTDPLVYDRNDAGAVTLAEASGARLVAVSGVERSAAGGYDGERLWVGSESIAVAGIDRTLAIDMAVAAATAAEVGVSMAAIGEAIEAFSLGPHRRTVVAEVGGVVWIDDSKATNPHAAIAAVDSYDSVILVAGGRNKGLDLTPLAAHRNVKRLIAIGEAGPDLLAAATGRGVAARDIFHAVSIAGDIAQPGDTVLLAPGCASFDQFESYAARGEAFADAVNARSN